MSEFVRIGQIVGAFGIKGQLKIDPLTEFLEERFRVGAKLRLNDKIVTITAVQILKGRPVISIDIVKDRNEAEKLQWQFIESDSNEPLELDDDEFLVEELIGLKVVTVSGQFVGEVEDVEENPAHDLLVIGTILIPLVSEFVKDIDFDTETITIDPIPGLLGEDDKVVTP